jgi:hypothetical protein
VGSHSIGFYFRDLGTGHGIDDAHAVVSLVNDQKQRLVRRAFHAAGILGLAHLGLTHGEKQRAE